MTDLAPQIQNCCRNETFPFKLRVLGILVSS